MLRHDKATQWHWKARGRTLGGNSEYSDGYGRKCQGRKFSGNAFYHGRRASYHHGTILVDVDMTVLQNYLNIPVQKIASKGVTSVKSHVINLRELVPNLTIEQVKDAMRRAFITEYGGAGDLVDVNRLTQGPEFTALYDKYRSWEWRLGKSPKFDVTLETRFPWGGVELGLMVSVGKIQSAKIFSDAMEAQLIEPMADSMVGLSYDRHEMCEALHNLANIDKNSIISDVAKWLKSSG